MSGGQRGIAARVACAVSALLPATYHRFALRWAHRAIARFYRTFNVTMFGCTVIARNRQDAVLLVRHSYADPDTWTLPGGAIDPRETPTHAAERELQEELQCGLQAARLFELEDAKYWNQRYITCMITGVVEHDMVPDNREVIDAKFFALDALPEAISPIARDRIFRWSEQMRSEDNDLTVRMTTLAPERVQSFA